MTVNASVNVAAGPNTEPGRFSAAFVLATVVTLAAVLPLGVLAWQARHDAPAESTGLVVSFAGTVTDLNGFMLESGDDAELLVDDANVIAVAWSLYGAGDELLHQGETVGAAPLSISLPVGTLSGLPPGHYDLLISGTTRDGTLTERAARFQIRAS